MANTFLLHSQDTANIVDIIDNNIIKNTYIEIEGHWFSDKGTTSFYLNRVLKEKVVNKGPSFRSMFLYKDNGTLKSSVEIKITGKKEGSYIIHMPTMSDFGNLKFIGGTLTQTGNSLKLIFGHEGYERGFLQTYYTEWDFYKSYPLAKDVERLRMIEIEKRKKNAPRSGTGFALSNNGYIITNYHVIENANSISVKGIKGDLSTSYYAEVVKADASVDLAILKVNDPLFINLGNVPYVIYKNDIDVGEEVFSLGYPLTNTMGEEIKLSTGVISAHSGFQGNKNLYQISVPLQPGNSGGPLFDKNGRIVGIVNSKHIDTDNVSYAIKARNLLGLLYMTPDVSVGTTNLLTGRTLSEKVKQVNSFIYIIEVNK